MPAIARRRASRHEFAGRPPRAPRRVDPAAALDSFEVRLSDEFDAPAALSWTYPGGGDAPSGTCSCVRIVSGDNYEPAGPRDPVADYLYAGRELSAFSDERALGAGNPWYRCYRAYAIHRTTHDGYRQRKVRHAVDAFDRPDEDPIGAPWSWEVVGMDYGNKVMIVGGRMYFYGLCSCLYGSGSMRSPGWRMTATITPASGYYDWHVYCGYHTGSWGLYDLWFDYNVEAGHVWSLKLGAPYGTQVIASGLGPMAEPVDVDLRLTSAWQLQARTSLGDASIDVVEGSRAQGGRLGFLGQLFYVDDVEIRMVTT